MKNFFLVLSHYNFIQIKVKTKKSMTLQSFNIRGWKWLSAYAHRSQVYNYLCATGYKVGLLFNFGHYDGLEIERKVK